MWLTVRETVAMETPERWATSRMLTLAGRRSGALFLAGLTVEAILLFPGVTRSHFYEKMEFKSCGRRMLRD
jgi:hypothetical protein